MEMIVIHAYNHQTGEPAVMHDKSLEQFVYNFVLLEYFYEMTCKIVIC